MVILDIAIDMVTLRPVIAIYMVIPETNYSRGYGYTGD